MTRGHELGVNPFSRARCPLSSLRIRPSNLLRLTWYTVEARRGAYDAGRLEVGITLVIAGCVTSWQSSVDTTHCRVTGWHIGRAPRRRIVQQTPCNSNGRDARHSNRPTSGASRFSKLMTLLWEKRDVQGPPSEDLGDLSTLELSKHVLIGPQSTSSVTYLPSLCTGK